MQMEELYRIRLPIGQILKNAANHLPRPDGTEVVIDDMRLDACTRELVVQYKLADLKDKDVDSPKQTE